MNENDLIKQKDTEIDILIRKNEALKDEVSELRAEVERLQNAYKQCAWERDVFAEDTREELAKRISEARKEFAERLEQIHISPSLHKTIKRLLAEMEERE